MAAMLLGGCGPAAGPPKSAEHADVTITVDGKRHKCIVALHSESQGSSVACGDVVPFLRDELRLRGGSSYDLRTIPDVDAQEMAKLKTTLREAGYRSIGAGG